MKIGPTLRGHDRGGGAVHWFRYTMGKISEGFKRINEILQTPITFESPRWNEEIVCSLPQDTEIGLQTARGRGFCYRYAYARSCESQNAGDIGEDYMVFKQGRDKFVFVICDGVSQSFYGDLAAKFLGNALIDWLWDLPEKLDDTRRIRFRMTEFLTALVPQAADITRQHLLSNDIPVLLREVLEQKRTIGSETIFVAGRMILPCKAIPQGHLFLTWMGDCRLRLWNPEQNGLIELGGEFKTEQRWSTERGMVGGMPQMFNSAFLANGKPLFSLLEAYSDGLGLLDDQWQRPVSNHNIEYLIKKSQAMPTSDDLSYLAVYPLSYCGRRPF